MPRANDDPSDVGDLFVVEVWGHLQEHGDVPTVRRRGGVAGLAHASEQIVERLRRLEIAEPGRVRGAHVHREVRGDGGERLDAGDVVGESVVRILVGADVDADDPRTASPPAEASERGLMPGVVEPEAVDDSLVLRQPEHPRARVARLGLRRDRSDLDEPEAHPQERVRRLGILVEAGGHADRVRELEPERAHLQARIGRDPRRPARAGLAAPRSRERCARSGRRRGTAPPTATSNRPCPCSVGRGSGVSSWRLITGASPSRWRSMASAAASAPGVVVMHGTRFAIAARRICQPSVWAPEPVGVLTTRSTSPLSMRSTTFGEPSPPS